MHMKVIIKVGNQPLESSVKYYNQKLDDIQLEKERMYKFLSECNNCIIEDADTFLLYALNSGMMAFMVQNNIPLQEEEQYLTPKFDPKVYRAFEVMENNEEVSIQDDEHGFISKNYFNKLMQSVMDDYFECLSLFEV